MADYKEWSGYCPAVDIYSSYAEEKDTVFLDSSLKNMYGNYSIIGIHPYLRIEDRNGELFVNGVPQKGTLTGYISDYLLHHEEENPTALPLLSGAVGYLTYDFGMRSLKLSSRHPKIVDIPEALFIFYEHFIIEDKKNRKIYLAAAGCLNNGEDSLAALEKDLQERLNCRTHTLLQPEIAQKGPCICSDFEKEEYLEAINKVINYIVEGDIYITNMTRQIRVESQVQPYEVFLRLHRNNPAPFSGYLNYGDFKMVCSSPERLLKLTAGIAETRPIKGTRKRGGNPAEDNALRAELLHSAKDRSELLMIVDLERNDLNKVCVPGSVEVPQLFEVEAYATVFHLVATITGKLKEGVTSMDLLTAMFPGGSITGAPKRRAMEIIDELEHSRRGIYTGSIGYLSLDNSCDFNIVIRTAVYKDGTYHLGVGGGITCESDLEFEFEETEQKAKALLEAMK
ncbi:aminodeoxychorismate synthase, component I [Desulfosporosinus acidiphilus SJ4]|uniref:Anthranilate synthase component 1 n=1 Tax=Desulfosporosinus acidiphilus (strain DSM 22704 / JCM 16185 / SJ4) TaxID=646529 RepID=I4D0N0_DESAJ|nr:aminodeoxychorismate synthase component I [Desulfosporosinus acidiphilus]AFM39354.1 aminodeoxychorismate synthase, component I [Desulfosporosinus acidiphilus SJ4]